jgi:hypothetical protein
MILPPEPNPTHIADPSANECEEGEVCKNFRDFAHGSSLESINNIVTNGLSLNAARNNSRGGLVNRPGSFFTIELTQQDGIAVSEKLQLAYEFGLNRGLPTAILIMQLCDDIYQELEVTNQVYTRPIAGAEEFTETIFRPECFATLNIYATFPQIIQLM